jgi:hypothetical protein
MNVNSNCIWQHKLNLFGRRFIQFN